MMNYCMECGTKLELRHLENEGEIPFCSQCNQFRFPIFNTAVSMICIDVKNQKILLIKQYGRPDYILVAGYISRGEDAEAAVKREVFEETGMTVDRGVGTDDKTCLGGLFQSVGKDGAGNDGSS